MKKNIKIVLLGGLALALFFNIFSFPSSTLADTGSNCLPNDFTETTHLGTTQKSSIVAALKKIYLSLAWRKCDCPYTYRDTTTYKCYTETFYSTSQNNELSGKDEIEGYLNGLETCGDFNKESACVKNQSDNYGGGRASDTERNTLINLLDTELHNPSSSTEKEISNSTSKLAKDFEVESYGTLDGSCALDMEFKPSMLNVFDWASGGLVYLFYVILRGLLAWILKIFQWFLNPGNFGGYINFLNFNGGSQQSLVRVLWDYMRNITNIGIIIGMIVIAVSTILGIKKFDWKKNLLKLLVVAALVNFSLIIAGMFVDLSNFISISAVTQFEEVSLPTLFIDGTVCPVVQGFYDLGPGAWPLTRAGAMGLMVTGIFLFQFVGLLLYLLTRIVTIIICLITSPVAFLALALPGLEKGWDFWRERFQQALVGLPALCITLYLSISFIGIVIKNLNERSSEGFLITFAYAAFIIAFVQLPRYVAKFLGIEQVEKGFQFAKKAVMGAAKAGAAVVGGFALGRAITSGAWKKAQTKFKKSNAPPLHGVGNWMDRQSKSFATRKGKQAEEFLEGQSEEEVNHFIEIRRKSGDRLGVAVGLNELIKRNKLKTKEHIGYMNFAGSVPSLNVKDAKKANPLLFAEFSNPVTPQIMARYMSYIEHKTGQTDPQKLREMAQEELINHNLNRAIIQAGKSKSEDLEKGNWQDIFEVASSLGEDKFNTFLYKLEETVTNPDALSKIFKTMNENVKRKYASAIVKAVEKEQKLSHSDAIDYLLITKGFHNSRFWNALIHK